MRPTRTRESHFIVVWRGSRSTGGSQAGRSVNRVRTMAARPGLPPHSLRAKCGQWALLPPPVPPGLDPSQSSRTWIRASRSSFVDRRPLQGPWAPSGRRTAPRATLAIGAGGRVGGEAMERWVASRGDPGALSRHGGRDPRGASPTPPLGPCRSWACPVDYPVRGRVRNPDDPDEVAGAPGAGGCGANAGYLGFAFGGSTRRPARPRKPGGIDAARGSEPG